MAFHYGQGGGGKNLKKKFLFFALTIFLFFSGFSLWKVFEFPKIEYYNLAQFIELLDKVKENYPIKQEPSELVYFSIDGMIQFLDPHSNFLDPKNYKAMVQRQEGRFSGIGIIVGLRNGKVTVISPIEGTPAYKLGIRAGDIIAEIDGVSTDNMSLSEVVDRLRGPKGTEVKVSIIRIGVKEPIQVKIIRDVITETSVRYPTVLEGNIGYIRITDFNKTTSEELRDGLKTLKEKGAEKLILDLRDNPGGLLTEAIKVSEFFLKPNSIVVYTRGRDSSANMELKTSGKAKPYSCPLIILVNSGSASASEIVAGALQDHDRALIVGQTTFGKGLVQSVFELPQDTALALTTARYYIPSGRCIQRDYSFLTDYLKGLNGKTDKKEYKTNSGRIVYGGGGVTPDILISEEKISYFQMKLQGLGLYFNFAIEYTSKTEVDENFNLNDEIIKEFLESLVNEKWITLEEKEKVLKDEKEMKILKFMLKREILSSKFGMTKGYQLTLKDDEQITKAIQYMPQAEELAKAYFAN